MEAILGFVGIVIAWWLFTTVLSAGTRTVGAAAKAVVGKGSFSDNMELAFKGMGAIEARLVDSTLGDDGDGPAIKAIEVKGIFPLNTTRQVGFMTSVFDKTDGEYKPVLSAIEIFQEPASTVYQHVSEIGQASPDTGFVRWSRVGGIVPDLLEPPVGGRRLLVALVRLIDLDNMPSIEHGFHEEGDAGILWQVSLDFDYFSNRQFRLWR